MNVDYYTSMSESGALALNFKATIDKFFVNPNDSNPRFCLGLKESGEIDWDIAQMSMIGETQWSPKDGMNSDVETFCGLAFSDSAEEKNDWIVT